jgi:hypothetical protein
VKPDPNDSPSLNETETLSGPHHSQTPAFHHPREPSGDRPLQDIDTESCGAFTTRDKISTLDKTNVEMWNLTLFENYFVEM